MERLQKILARAGFGSRRAVEELIKKGVVTVNGEVATLGAKADLETDKVCVFGKEILLEKKVYYLLNKPDGFICTLKDPFNRPKVVDLLPKEPRVFPVGRLDVDTTGALILTNDGELANQLLHPKYHVEKTYSVRVNGLLDDGIYKKLEAGLLLDDGLTKPAKVQFVKSGRNWTQILLTISEGRKRQVKRMMSFLGHEVFELHRVKFGPIELGKLKIGEYRHLREDELKMLKGCANK